MNALFQNPLQTPYQPAVASDGVEYAREGWDDDLQYALKQHAAHQHLIPPVSAQGVKTNGGSIFDDVQALQVQQKVILDCLERLTQSVERLTSQPQTLPNGQPQNTSGQPWKISAGAFDYRNQNQQIDPVARELAEPRIASAFASLGVNPPRSFPSFVDRNQYPGAEDSTVYFN